ncbi:MAG: type II secretion system protein GspN [Myxococcales bacterium]|nr:type II secretion system protein GspN [Myxococcales bacterium]
MWLLWGAVAVISMVFFLQWTFPYDRVKDRVVDALSAKYNVTVGSVHRGFLPGRMSLRKVALESRPSKVGEVPRVIFIDRIDLQVGMFAAITGNLDLGFDVAMGGGTIEGNVELSKAAVEVTLDGRGVPMVSVPGLAEAVGLPVGGKLNTKVALHMPYTTKGKRAIDIPKMSGVITLACVVGCTVGDGVARVKPGANANSKNAIFGADGIVVPQLTINSFSLALAFDKGHAKVKSFELVSADGDADIELDIALAPEFPASEVKGCIKFKLSPELKAREEKFGNIQAFIGTPIDKEGYNNIELFRTVRQMGRRPAEACSAASLDDDDRDAPQTQPTRPPVRPDLPLSAQDAAAAPLQPIVPADAPVAPAIVPDAPTIGAATDAPRIDPAAMTADDAEAMRRRVMEAADRAESPPPASVDAPPADYVQ